MDRQGWDGCDSDVAGEVAAAVVVGVGVAAVAGGGQESEDVPGGE